MKFYSFYIFIFVPKNCLENKKIKKKLENDEKSNEKSNENGNVVYGNDREIGLICSYW